MHRNLILLLIHLVLACPLLAQSNQSISGTVYSASTNLPLRDVTISHLLSDLGSNTDSTGRFILDIPSGLEAVFQISHIGYTSQIVRSNDSNELIITLQKADITIRPVVIRAAAMNAGTASSSTVSLSLLEAKSVPALFGEMDPFKVLQLKPGISSGSEGNSKLFVRGGNGDQNLILLDGATIYNPDHLFGFFSTFYGEVLESFTAYKGGFPAQYGGRLSSVIDIKTKNTYSDSLRWTGGLGLISSRLALDGPIFNDQTHFMIGGRRTYVDLFTELANKSNANKEDRSPIPKYQFYDINGKLTTRWADRHQLSLSLYSGSDRFKFDNDFLNLQFNWGNTAGILNWEYQISDQLSTQLSSTFTQYQYTIANVVEEFNFDVGSNIKDYGLSGAIDYQLSQHHFKLGMQWTYRSFILGRIKAGSSSDDFNFSAGTQPSGNEYGLYISDQFSWNSQWIADIGLRYSGYLDSPTFYHRLEPRLGLVFKSNNHWNFSTSYSVMNQYLHLISNNGISIPTDLWYPSTSKVKPQRSQQWVVGAKYISDRGLVISHEYYYKLLHNQVELQDHSQLFANDQLENSLVFGDGYAYGSEVSIEKKWGQWTGWLSYTLAWVKRGNFETIDAGQYFPPRYDRRHDLSAVFNLAIGKKWNIGTTFIFGSGDRTWLPAGRFAILDIDGINPQPIIPIYGERNSIQLPNYHRMDLSVSRDMNVKWGKSQLVLSIYNIYNRRNPYFLYLDATLSPLVPNQEVLTVPTKIVAKQVSLFPIIPSISWNFNL